MRLKREGTFVVKQVKIQAALVGIFIFFLFLSSIIMFSNQEANKARNQSLTGVVNTVGQPNWTADSWMKGQFQQQYATWFGNNFGLRTWLIRMNNQLYYSVFSKSYMYDQMLVIGKERTLYTKDYIQEYCGLLPAATDEALQRSIAKMDLLNRKLAARGVVLVVMVTPSKASIYPEFIPEVFMSQKKTALRTYDKMIPLLKQAGIRYVDGHAVTLAEKAKAPAPVFGQGSAHWNTYTASFTVDRLIEVLEDASRQHLPHLVRSNEKVEQKAKGSDLDLANLLNLWVTPDVFPVPVAKISRENNFAAQKTALFMGDSFTWIPLEILHAGEVFRQIDFYYYYRRTKATYVAGQPQKLAPEVDVKALDWEKEIFNHDYFILSLNELYLQGEHLEVFVDDALKKL